MYGYVFFMLRILKHLLFICYFGDLAERTKIVMAWPGDHRPSVFRGITTSKTFGRENANFSAFQILLKISLVRERMCLQRIRKRS